VPDWSSYRAIHVIDFEFGETPDGHPAVRCLVDHDVVSGNTRREWLDGRGLAVAPITYGEDELVVAYYATAEASCIHQLGWARPRHMLDLFAEFRVETNGLSITNGRGLLGALAHFGIPGMDVADKEAYRALALRGGPYSADEREALLAYCESDVVGTTRLLAKVRDTIDLPRALLRGRYMQALAEVERVGVPIDACALVRVHEQRPQLQERLVASVADIGCYDGLIFSAARWSGWLGAHGIEWPRDERGRLRLDEDTFAARAGTNANVARVHRVRRTLAQLRKWKLEAKGDGRLRCMTSAFSSRTGRNQPRSSKFIFGAPSWARGLVRPEPGRALAYVDWSSQEFGIAAALSGDVAMIQAYVEGDPYMAFGRQSGFLPAHATRETHSAERAQLKVVSLAAQYGQGPDGLAVQLGVDRGRAASLLALHRRSYRTFWEWSQAAVDCAQLHRRLVASFGWTLHVPPDANDRTLRNFPIQANAAEMMRLATIFAVDRGLSIAAIVHDAFLIDAPVDAIGDACASMQECMSTASALVLDGLVLRSDARIVRDGQSLIEPRGQAIWQLVTEFLTGCP
jgi:DNA polymerase-1